MKLYLSRLASRLPKYTSAMGFLAGIGYTLLKIREKLRLAPDEARVRSKYLVHTLSVRTRPSSDTLAFEQVCVDRDFDFVNRLSDPVRFVLDLGANIGCASAFFLTAFPNAFVLAVEPDPENALRCQENLRPYGDRARVVQGAVWHSGGELILSRGNQKDWGIQVRRAVRGETADVVAYSVPDLLKQAGFPVVELLKIDIEGSEQTLFSENTDRWLSSVRNICIELHGQECEAAFLQALEGFQYDSDRLGEHMLCLNLSRQT